MFFPSACLSQVRLDPPLKAEHKLQLLQESSREHSPWGPSPCKACKALDQPSPFNLLLGSRNTVAFVQVCTETKGHRGEATET